jgi:hypothetical protein
LWYFVQARLLLDLTYPAGRQAINNKKYETHRLKNMRFCKKPSVAYPGNGRLVNGVRHQVQHAAEDIAFPPPLPETVFLRLTTLSRVLIDE